MKIKPEHYEVMLQALRDYRDQYPHRTPQYYRDFELGKDHDERHRWDALYAATLSVWLCDVIYPYADDTHIDTALRRAQKEVWPEDFNNVGNQDKNSED